MYSLWSYLLCDDKCYNPLFPNKESPIKYFKRVLLSIFILAALYGVGRLAVVSYDSYVHLPRQPYLQMQTHESITVKWQTPDAEIGCVHYGLETTEQKICESKATKQHQLQIAGLKPDTHYRYRVDASSLSIDNQDRSFRTLSSDNNRTQRLWIIGDSGKAGTHQDKVFKSMLEYLGKTPLDLWILLGDNAYRSGTQKQYNTNLFTPYETLLKTHVPWAVIGNHDARRWAFYEIFDFPTKGESGGIPSRTEQFYAIDQGNLHIVMIDTETTDLGKDGALAKWLEKDLAAHTKMWTMVAMHHPPYTHGGHNSDNPHDSHYKLSAQGRLFLVRENIIPIMEKYDVDLVYGGHSHVYERSKLMHQHYEDSSHFDPAKHLVSNDDNDYCKTQEKKAYGGTIYTVMGSSAKLDHSTLSHPAMPFAFEEMGSVLLEVNATRLQAQFINEEGNISDTFTLTKKSVCP